MQLITLFSYPTWLGVILSWLLLFPLKTNKYFAVDSALPQYHKKVNSSAHHYPNNDPILYKKIDVPTALVTEQDTLTYGGDIRIGDLQNRGQLDFLVYRAANSVEGGATQPCFLGAFDMEGNILWQKGSGGKQPNRPGPVAIHDIDADGEMEVICLYAEDTTTVSPFSMKNTQLCLLNGKEGTIERQSQPIELSRTEGEGPNWVHQRILIANLRGTPTPQDFIIKLGKTVYAFDHELNILWTYFNPNDAYQNCPAYIPAVGDMDGDGRDEINGGYYVLSHTGGVLWERKLGKNMDSVTIDGWDKDSTQRAFCSGEGFVMSRVGDTILHLGAEAIPHGQELRVADLDKAFPGREMVIRYKGHKPDVKIIEQTGQILHTFQLNESPNNTGMEIIYWEGSDQPALIYNGGTLWSGKGTLLHRFDALTVPPVGNKRQGWYHCIPVDIVGDEGEEVVLYNPWENFIYLYAADREGWSNMKNYHHTARQYNVRLMD